MGEGNRGGASKCPGDVRRSRREVDSEEGVVLNLHCLFLETLKIKTWFKVQQIMFIERKENHSVI